MEDYRNQATELVAALKKQGADSCDVYISASSYFTTRVRLGKIEKLEQAISKGLGVRVFKGGALAGTYTTDFTERSVKYLARETMEIVKISSADKFNGLAPKEKLGVCESKMLLFDDALAKLTTEKKIEMAREAEEGGMKFDKRITNTKGAGWYDSRNQVTLANSDGFVGQYKTTGAGMNVSLVAEENGVMQTDGWGLGNRFLNRLDSPKAIGEEAASRVLRKLGGRKPKSQVVPVVVSPEVASQLVATLFGSAAGGGIYRRSSFLVDKAGQEIASPLLTIIDDATMAEGPASRPFDAEGVKSAQVTLLEKGVLKNYICDAYSARRLNLQPTGNTSRNYQSGPFVSASNLFLKPGASDPQEIIKSVKNGLYLTELNGFGFNGVTGDLSRGALGFWIENGQLSYPVQEFVFAGNFLTLLKNITMVGNDLNWKLGNVVAPTLLISEATIGGA